MNKNPLRIIRIGLALVFLANGLMAFLAPQEFMDLLGASFVTQILPLPISALVLFIGFNDSLMSVLILLNKYQKYVFGWAMIWLIGVMVVTGEPFGILEHLGFFSMALSLWISAYHANNDKGRK